MPLLPESAIGVYHPGTTSLSLCDPMREALKPFFEVVRSLAGGVKVEVEETVSVEEMVSVEVDNPVAQPADLVKLDELLISGA